MNLFAFSQSQDTIKIVTYNLLNYPASGSAMSPDTSSRNPHFRTILNAINPDILVVQELTSSPGGNGFLSHVLNANSASYTMGPFINGYDSDNGIFFKSSKFHSCTNKAIDTELRDINEFKLVHTLSGDTIRIYSLHLKASTGSSNEAQRAREVDSLRKVTNALPLGTDFIVCGDFNIYGSTESAYQKLKQVIGGNQGHVIDPVNMTGSFGQGFYAIHHTQSPRVRNLPDGGAVGGLDDRFDMILYSLAVSQAGGIRYVANSNTAFGNDGTLYNDSVNHPSNSAVSPAIANALHYAADHLPVIAKFTFEYTSGATPTDFGVTALTEPENPMCGNAAQNISVTVKNFGALPVDFSSDELEVHVLVSTPSFVDYSVSSTINSGSLAAGAIMQVNFSSLIDMSGSGTYTFKCYTVQANDANPLNDTLALTSVNVTSATAEISPAGPQSICTGDSIQLSANTGASYLWSNGATTQSIYADSGSYTVQVTISGGCATISSPVNVSYFTPANGGFTESMGTVGGTTAIATHESNNGFDNDDFTMTGTADIRVTTPSTGYSGASGAANVFFTTSATRTFIISGINTSGMSNIQLAHGLHKSTNASNGSAMVVEVSSDGVDYTPLSAPALPTGTGTATWHYRTLSGTIPAVPNLRIRFTATTSTDSYRLDDITLSGDPITPTITVSGSTSLCTGDSVELTASTGNVYRWNTGQTSQSITVSSSGEYSVRVDCAESDTLSVSVNNCTDVTLQLKAFIQGFYIGNQSMNAVADPVNHPGICDTIIISLADAQSPHNIQHSITSVLSTDGTGSFVFPPAVFNDSFYIVLNHRNSLETWSSEPLIFNDTIILYDFTTTAGKAYGNNLANIEGEFCVFSGDITDGISTGTQDGMIDILDYNLLESSLLQFLTGYQVYDLTGDGVVESADFSLMETNSFPAIPMMRP